MKVQEHITDSHGNVFNILINIITPFLAEGKIAPSAFIQVRSGFFSVKLKELG